MKTETAITAENQNSALKPIVIDFGKHSRKNIKKIRKGDGGKLMDKLHDATSQLRADGTMLPQAQPVFIIVRERRRGPRGLRSILG